MIHDLLTACKTGEDLLLVYLLWIGWSYSEIGRETGTSKATISRRIAAIRQRLT